MTLYNLNHRKTTASFFIRLSRYENEIRSAACTKVIIKIIHTIYNNYNNIALIKKYYIMLIVIFFNHVYGSVYYASLMQQQQ